LKLLNKIQDYLGKEPDYYGFATIIKEYAGFPQWIPLPAHYEHGWTDYPNPGKTDLETNKNLMLVFSKRREEAWKRHSAIPVAVIGAPFVHYRRSNLIHKDINARGTVAFPAHSTSLIEVKYDLSAFCDQLNKLNSRYQPITICMHGEDLDKGLDNYFVKRGFKVVSAGKEDDRDFYIKFYNILRKHQYAVSNSIGSHVFYAIEMEIPFYYIDLERQFINRGDPNLEDPNNAYKERIEIVNKMKNTLSTKEGVITDEQRMLVAEELGIDDCISGRKLRYLLWKTFLLKDLFIYLKKIFRYAMKLILRK
jgi:hypothetical protein